MKRMITSLAMMLSFVLQGHTQVLLNQCESASPCNARVICGATITSNFSYTTSPAFNPIGTCASSTGTYAFASNWVYYRFTCYSTGILNFRLNSNDSAGAAHDLDWALWDITNSGCSSLTIANVVECNAAGNGATGIRTGGIPASNFEPNTTITAGSDYIIGISNPGGGHTLGFTLNFSGTTAIIADTRKPFLSAVAPLDPCLPVSSIKVKLSEPVRCDQIGSPFGADVSISGLTTSSFTVTPLHCEGCVNAAPNTNPNFYGNATDSIRIDFDGNLPSGTYTINPLANAFFDLCGKADSVQATLTFTVPASSTNSFDLVLACDAYTWEGVTYTTSGTATHTYVNSSGCDSILTLSIMINASPSPTINPSGPLTFCNGNSVVLTANTASGLNYQWYKNGVIINGATANSYIASLSGSYTVGETNGSNCSAVSAPQVVTVNNCNVDLQLRLFLQGYYTGASMMQPVLMNETMSADPNITDTILIELHNPLPPYGLVLSQPAILHTDGTASSTFNYYNGNYYLSGPYYLAVRHRNGLTTWSANPVAFVSPSVQYDFTTAANKAYGNNMLEVDPGVWAFFNGDLNTDDNIDLLDLPLLETDINNFAYGYFKTDLNGDGNVDLFDISILEPIISDFVFSYQPAWSGTLPSVSTATVSLLNAITAISGGQILSDGGNTITASGVCWSTNPNPTIADNKTSDGTGPGNFVSTLSNLNPNTTYYVRAYATNEVGTVYGNQLSFVTGN